MRKYRAGYKHRTVRIKQSPPPPQLGQSDFVSPSFAPSSPSQTSFLPARSDRVENQQTLSILVAASLLCLYLEDPGFKTGGGD
jgi:hypothetical protein